MITLQYSEITDAVLAMNYDDKVELKELLNHYIAEESRDNILKNANESKNEAKHGNINFYNSADELKMALDND